jgi:hypothetical protein
VTGQTGQATGQATDQAAQAMMQAHLESLQDQILHLRRQLEESHEANRENRRIIAGLVQRVPELEATPERREHDVSASEERGNGGGVPHAGQGQEKPVSWWRKIFFG